MSYYQIFKTAITVAVGATIGAYGVRMSVDGLKRLIGKKPAATTN